MKTGPIGRKYVPHSGSIVVQSDRWKTEMRYCKQQCGTSITQTQGEWEMHRDIVQQQSPVIVQVLSSQCTSKISVNDSDKLPFDDIEINSTAYHGQDNILQEFLASAEDQDSDLNIINGANPMFNSSYANRMRQKHKKLNWKDLGLAELLSDKNHVHDQTILAKPQFGTSEPQTASESPHERTEEQVLPDPDIAELEEPETEEFATPIIPNRTIHQNLYSRQRKLRKPSTEYQTPQSHARIIR
ncbi:hypothetical protein KL943_000993 [Ogataea angusta]|nr:hypothetical protein KL943_000993 [Ogataea angusta]